MQKITSHSYYVVTRKIEHQVQSVEETEHEIRLNTDSIDCSSKSFLMKDVFDVSYKSLNTKQGFLYLHTNQGVYSFLVKQDPHAFIQAYKELQST
ncbi:hypothetical protein V1502_08865 [Bacillus sp. SCS-153A]|uniref:hypothetical protein n=1 Tax=Rossellomorea sedimentorum TaxID=3115294 RepID=UPI003905D62E